VSWKYGHQEKIYKLSVNGCIINSIHKMEN
jgi:hypothetical protein